MPNLDALTWSRPAFLGSLRAFALFASCVTTGLTMAATTSVSGTVSARVVPECSLSVVTPLNFGTLVMAGPAASSLTQATGSMVAQCSNGYAYKIYANSGANASGTPRLRLGVTGNYLAYTIYSDAGYTTAFPTTLGTALSATGLSAQQFISVYGRMPAQSAAAVGTYTDTLTFTVSF